MFSKLFSKNKKSTSVSQAESINIQRERAELKNNLVTVNIWTSGFNPTLKGDNVGHVSIRLPNGRYISLWPKTAVENPFSGKSEPDFVLDFEEDLRREGRQPEAAFRLYSLKASEMEKKFDSYKNSLDGWCLFGGCRENLESCVSLAWSILEAGGINSLIPKIKSVVAMTSQSTYGSVNASQGIVTSDKEQSVSGSVYASEQIISPFVKSPDSVVTDLKIAKEEELKSYPLTKELDNLDQVNEVRIQVTV